MQKYRLLLVDDDEDYFIFTRDLLNEIPTMQFTVEWATHVDPALSRLEIAAYDVCLVDYMLGQQNGLDLLRSMRARGILTPVIVLTGREDLDIDFQAMQAGASDYLTKAGLTVPLLERTIRYAINHTRTLTALRTSQQALNREVEKLTLLRLIENELSDTLDLNFVLSVGLDAAMRFSAADLGHIAIFDSSGTLGIRKYLGPPESSEPLRPEAGIVARVLRTGKANFIQDVDFDPDYYAVNSATRAQITLPLLAHEQVIGVLNIETSKPYRFTQEVFEFLQLVMARVAVALDNARLYQLSQTQLTELRTLYEEVSRLEQLKTDMIRIASHDLRNPLSTLNGYLELLGWDAEELAPKHRDYVQTMQVASRRMQKIISDILSLERIAQIAQEGSSQTITLQEIVESVYEESRDSAVQKGQELLLEIAPDPLVVLGDPAQLSEAVANLVSNAVKYTPSGGKVLVRLQGNAVKARFEVLDNGYGIPSEAQKRLFEPFYRVKMRENAGIEGTGLGLHLVKKIVERHHGRMIFSSVYGEGSIFGFELPLEKI